MFWFWNRNYFCWDQSEWNVSILFLFSLVSLGSSWIHLHLISCLCLFLATHVSSRYLFLLLLLLLWLKLQDPCFWGRSLSGQPLGCSSILCSTEAPPQHLGPTDLCLGRASKAKGSNILPLHAAYAQPTHCAHPQPCTLWDMTQPHRGGHDPTSCLVTSTRQEWCMPEGPARLGWEPWHCCSWHPTDHSLALFCINPCRRSTSSGVTSTHGFSLRFPPRRAWCEQRSISASLWLF